MIAAHGVTIAVSNEAITIAPTALAASLGGLSGNTEIEVASITGVDTSDGDEWDKGFVRLVTGSSSTTIEFPPNSAAQVQAFASVIEAAQEGSVSDSGLVKTKVPGLDFVGFDVETANSNWGSICQIGVVKMIDGVEAERASWLCTPPEAINYFEPFNVNIHGITAEDVKDAPSFEKRAEELIDFIGDLPFVAHNAQFDATALRDASKAAGVDLPQMIFADSLAQSRASKLTVKNHKLPTVASALGVNLENHHDAAADASAAAEIMVELARRAQHSGSLMELVHSTGFTLGVIEKDRVVPVLKDRSGASRSVQASRLAAAAAGQETPAVEVSPAPEVSGAGTDQPSRRGPAPWQSVATPDEIPEPNQEADPNNPLFGQSVTLTGEFEPFDKGTLWQGIAHSGGQVAKNVTKKTTILVTGTWAKMTSKEKRARELQDKGQDIQIWPAEKLLEVLGLDEQPPF